MGEVQWQGQEAYDVHGTQNWIVLCLRSVHGYGRRHHTRVQQYSIDEDDKRKKRSSVFEQLKLEDLEKDDGVDDTLITLLDKLLENNITYM